MNKDRLIKTARTLLAGDRGLIAIDESTATCNKRFAAAGIAQTPDMRRAWRELIVTTPNLGQCISGAILFDETIRQTLSDGTPFAKALHVRGIVAGIKVDMGAVNMPGQPGEKLTTGLDGLGERLAEYAAMGARFAKWRAVITVGEGLPSSACLNANAEALADYAALCQAHDIVPIVEPEVLMDGAHSLEACLAATQAALHATFAALARQQVLLEGLILKPNMVLPGLASPRQASADEVADATLKALLHAVPASVAGVAFLSGGQSGLLATERLNAINIHAKKPDAAAPWPLAFSFARAVQQQALDIWQGRGENVAAAQAALFHRVNANRAARDGAWTSAMERM